MRDNMCGRPLQVSSEGNIQLLWEGPETTSTQVILSLVTLVKGRNETKIHKGEWNLGGDSRPAIVHICYNLFSACIGIISARLAQTYNLDVMESLIPEKPMCGEEASKRHSVTRENGTARGRTVHTVALQGNVSTWINIKRMVLLLFSKSVTRLAKNVLIYYKRLYSKDHEKTLHPMCSRGSTV